MEVHPAIQAASDPLEWYSAPRRDQLPSKVTRVAKLWLNQTISSDLIRIKIRVYVLRFLVGILFISNRNKLKIIQISPKQGKDLLLQTGYSLAQTWARESTKALSTQSLVELSTKLVKNDEYSNLFVSRQFIVTVHLSNKIKNRIRISTLWALIKY